MILDRLMMLELERGTEHLQMKNIRTIATSLLLFQHCLFPVTIFAEEAPVEIDTELVQRLQEQNELPAIESSPPTTESTAEEPVHTEPAEVPTTEDSNPEQSEQPKQPETVETAEPPIPETSEETAETTTPSAEDGKESSEGNGLPSPVLPKEEEMEQLMVLPEAMRMSTYSLPNLNAYRHHLVDNGRSAYINQKMQGATNRTLTLGAGVGATQSFSVSFDTYTMVQAPGNGWISWIASNLSTAPDYYFQQMYYGNHPSFSNPYTLNNLRWSGVPSYLSVTATPTISGRQVTINVTIVRTKATTSDMNDKDTIRLLGNLTMGTTAVAPQVNNYSKKIADVNYSDAVIGEIVVNNPKPSVVIKDSVDVEATRNALSQDTIKSWFTTLPSNSNDYTFSATGPASWAPGATGTATVSMKHNSNGSTQTFTTRYTVRDTQKPTAKFKKTGVEIEARRTGDWTREDLLKFIDSDLQDNWSLPENIRIEATDNNGIYPLAGRSPRDTWAYVDIYDEAGNQYGEYVEFKIVDTQRPTGTVKSGTIDIEARRSGELSQAELREFFATMSDNWTLPENLKIHLVNPSGTPLSIAGKAPLSSLLSYIRLEDEAGNTSLNPSTIIRIVDTQAPTGTVKSDITIEARRTGDLSQAELRGFFSTMSDNWTLSENMKVHLVDGNGTATTIAGKAPGTHTLYLQLEDEAGNKSARTSVTIRIVDTQAPTGTVKSGTIDVEARRSTNLSQQELRELFTTLNDNWTLSENIKVYLVDDFGTATTVAGKAPGTETTFYLQLEDEAGNISGNVGSKRIRIVDTQRPTGTVKSDITIEARRSGELSEAEIRGFFSTMNDNWTLSENMKVHFVDGNGAQATVAGKEPSTRIFYLYLEDEAGNKSFWMEVRIRIVDTQKPTAKFKKTGAEIEARRTGDWTREDLLKFIDSDLQDNWSLPENIRIEATDNNGIYPLAGRSPRDTWAYVDIYDEAGNQYGEYVEFKIVDTQRPTGTVKSGTIDIEARRSGELSQAELREFFATMSDNWTLPENLKIHLVNPSGTPLSIAGKAPLSSLLSYIRLEDEAGNTSLNPSTIIRIVDTQAPTGTLNTVIPAFEYRTQGDWSREELLTFFTSELSDNWSEHKNITATMNRSIVDFSPSVNLQQATLTLTDEAGNKQSYPVQFLLTSFVIQPNVLIQAQRMPALSKETIKSWFQGLPSMVDDHYDFSTPESANGWEPGKTGQANVTIRNKVSNTTQQQTTNYTVVDTEAPKGTVKYRYTVEANRSRDFTQEELRQIFQSLSDNWSLPEKITLKTSNLTGLSPNIPGYHYLLKITATDEEKNSQVFENVAVVIEDTQAPTATVKGETIDVEARRTGGLTREELLRFVDGGLLDNWSLPDDISLSVVVPQGTGYVAMDVNQKPGTFMTGHLLLTDEFGNQTIPGPKNQISLNIRDTQVPTGTVRQDVSVEARRSGELSETELHGFMATMSDNWTLAENIKVHLVDGNETATTVAGKAPGIHSLYLQLEDEAGNKSARMSIQIRIVDTQRPTGTVKSGTIDIEARRSGELSQMELRGFFTTMSDNWTLPENLKIHLVNPSGTPLSIAGKAPLSSLLGYIRLEDEAGNMSLNPSTIIRIVDTQAPTGTVKSETIDVEARRTGELSQTELRQFFTTMSDNWTLAENMKVYLVNAAGAEVSIAGYKPGTIVPSFNSYIRLEDEARNKSMLMPITLRIVDTQAPEGTVKEHRLTMEADRSRNFTQEELRQFFEELSDNWSHLEDITLKSSGSLSSLGPNTENNHYVLAITATDEEKNSKRFERALVRINDTQAPTGTVKSEHMDIEARRTGELSQAELRQFFTSVNDNWTLSKDIRFHLVNADGTATSIAGMNPGTLLDAYIQLEDEAGNKSSPMKISANIVDTTGPQGKLKENLAFQKGSAEPNARDYLDGEPSDNWTAPEAIKVTVVYENNAQFTDLTIGTHKFVLTLADEYGNTTDLSGELEIKMNLKGYVDVTIPARISFAESKESGGIVSPKYQIQNNSNEELTVSVASMTSQSQTEKLTDIDLLMSNNYNDATIPLIENGQNLSQKTELVTLPKKTSSFAFSLYGTVGQNFDFDSLTDPLKPQYALQFNFTIN